MRFRKLRIAWSIGCGIACLLLIVLWMRSYWLVDVMEQRWPGRFQIASFGGRVGISKTSNSDITLFRDATDGDSDFEGEWLYEKGWLCFSTSMDFSMDEFPATCGFGWRDDPLVATLTLPDWFLAATLAIFASVPWLRCRFTLRTLLIATMLVAVVLGVVVYTASK